MGTFEGSWKLDDYLTIMVNTHNASTGAQTDADSAPTYRVYEDITDTPIIDGSLAKVDDANTTGFYGVRFQADSSSGVGFEKGKSYHVRVEATVDSITAAAIFSFQIEAEVDANTVSGTVDIGKVTGTPVIDVDDFKADVTNLDVAVSSRASSAQLSGKIATGAIVGNLLTTSGPIEYVQNDEKTITFDLGTSWNLTGKAVFFIVKASKDAADSTAIINAECTVTDAVNGIATYTPGDNSADDTSTLGRYHGEVKVYDGASSLGDQMTAYQNDFTIIQSVAGTA